MKSRREHRSFLIHPLRTRTAPLVAHDLTFRLPDGRTLFEGLHLRTDRNLAGLTAPNGAGKSVLGRILAGLTEPTAGTVTRTARIGFLDQRPAHDPSATLAQLLGVARPLEALDRLERGEGAAEDLAFDADLWLLPKRIDEALQRVGLHGFPLDRPIGTLSGGEATRVAIGHILLRDAEFLILDEPTNHLDRDWRDWLSDFLAEWKGGALVISHDRALLESMDRMHELRPDGLRTVGGGWSAFAEVRDREREAALQDLQAAEQALDQATATIQRERERKQKRSTRGQRAAERRGASSIEISGMKERASGSSRATEQRAARQLAQRAAERAEARERAWQAAPLALSIPRSGLHATARIATLRDVVVERGGRRLLGPLDLEVRGPMRLAITGANGAGKSTLIGVIAGTIAPSRGTLQSLADPSRMVLVDQQASLLGESGRAVDAFVRLAPERDEGFARLILGRFGLRTAAAERPVSGLSGGERMRIALAAVMHRDPTPSCLLLDEPSNHLDIESLEVVEEALRGYDGALVIVSHDEYFLEQVGVEERLELVPPADR